MRSKTSYFNRTLFNKTALRFWPIWTIYAFVWLVVLPLGMRQQFDSYVGIGSDYAMLRTMYGMPLSSAVSAGGAVICLIFTSAAAAASFSHLYSPRAVSTYGALPIKRDGSFLTLSLAGIVPLLLANVFVALVTLAVEAVIGNAVLWPMAVWLGVISLECVAFYGIAVLTAQFTANIVIYPLLVAAMNFSAVLVDLVGQALLKVFVFGYTETESFLTLLSPVFGLRNNLSMDWLYEDVDGVSTLSGYAFSGWGCAIAYAVVGLICLGIALVFYKKRRLETVGDVVAVSWLRPVFKYLLAFGLSLGLGTLLFYFTSGDVYYGTTRYAIELGIYFIFGAFVGLFAADMLLKKSFDVFRSSKNWIGFGVISCVMILALVCCETDAFGYERRVPASEDVASVEFYVSDDYGETFTITDPEQIAELVDIHASIVSHKAGYEAETNSDGNTVEAAEVYTARGNVSYTDYYTDYSNPRCYLNLSISYTLSDGSELKRDYTIFSRDTYGDFASLEDFLNSPDVMALRLEGDFPVTLENIAYAELSTSYHYLNGSHYYARLGTEAAHELYYDCILPDIADGSIGRSHIVEDNDFYDGVYDVWIGIDCMESLRTGEGGERTQYLHFRVDTSAERTAAWLEEHGIELLTLREAMELNDNTDSDITFID